MNDIHHEIKNVLLDITILGNKVEELRDYVDELYDRLEELVVISDDKETLNKRRM